MRRSVAGFNRWLVFATVLLGLIPAPGSGCLLGWFCAKRRAPSWMPGNGAAS
jgi:hypothetical protein